MVLVIIFGPKKEVCQKKKSAKGFGVGRRKRGGDRGDIQNFLQKKEVYRLGPSLNDRETQVSKRLYKQGACNNQTENEGKGRLTIREETKINKEGKAAGGPKVPSGNLTLAERRFCSVTP